MGFEIDSDAELNATYDDMEERLYERLEEKISDEFARRKAQAVPGDARYKHSPATIAMMFLLAEFGFSYESIARAFNTRGAFVAKVHRGERRKEIFETLKA